MNPQEAPKTCSDCVCKCHKCAPVCIVLIGVAFLLQALGWLSEGVVSYAWPILLILFGAGKMCKCCK